MSIQVSYFWLIMLFYRLRCICIFMLHGGNFGFFRRVKNAIFPSLKFCLKYEVYNAILYYTILNYLNLEGRLQFRL